MTHHITLNWSGMKLCESWQCLTLMIVDWLMLPGVWIKWKTTGVCQWAWCQVRVRAGHVSNPNLYLGDFFSLCVWVLYLSLSTPATVWFQIVSVVYLLKSQLKCAFQHFWLVTPWNKTTSTCEANFVFIVLCSFLLHLCSLIGMVTYSWTRKTNKTNSFYVTEIFLLSSFDSLSSINFWHIAKYSKNITFQCV